MGYTDPYPLHGGQLGKLAERFGIRRTDLLDFSANINPDGPPPAVLSALRSSLEDPSTLTEYPDLEELDLKQSIAVYADIGVEHLAVANGFVPLLEAVLRTTRIRRCLLPVPAFAEYRKTLTRAEIEISLHPLDSRDCFSYNIQALTAGQHDAILLANPQNPSGVCHNAEVLGNLVARCAERNAYVLLDEAFIDYVPKHSLTRMIDRYPNLIVFRSVTKFHGAPGLRVAYAVSNAALSSSISDNLSPWSITTLAARAVSAALKDLPYAARSVTHNVNRRSILQRDLESLGLIVYPSAANFLLFRLPLGVNQDAFWQHMIAKHRIVLRACANYEGLAAGHFRVAIRSGEENSRLSRAIAESLTEDAVFRL